MKYTASRRSGLDDALPEIRHEPLSRRRNFYLTGLAEERDSISMATHRLRAAREDLMGRPSSSSQLSSVNASGAVRSAIKSREKEGPDRTIQPISVGWPKALEQQLTITRIKHVSLPQPGNDVVDHRSCDVPAIIQCLRYPMRHPTKSRWA